LKTHNQCTNNVDPDETFRVFFRISIETKLLLTMNPKLEHLRVAVVPTETGNGIDQQSTVEEILNCPETRLYALTDYFKAQNDEEIDLLHWSFLIDIVTKEDLTGANMPGIHMAEKMHTAHLVEEIRVKDPDSKSDVDLAIYKHEGGGMFAMDISFLDQVVNTDDFDRPIIPDPFSDSGAEEGEIEHVLLFD